MRTHPLLWLSRMAEDEVEVVLTARSGTLGMAFGMVGRVEPRGLTPPVVRRLHSAACQRSQD
jgi:hypothetical protein